MGRADLPPQCDPNHLESPPQKAYRFRCPHCLPTHPRVPDRSASGSTPPSLAERVARARTWRAAGLSVAIDDADLRSGRLNPLCDGAADAPCCAGHHNNAAVQAIAALAVRRGIHGTAVYFFDLSSFSTHPEKPTPNFVVVARLPSSPC